MLKYHEVRKVTVYAAGALEKSLIEQFLKLGVKGYTLTDCRGHGAHDVVDDPLYPTSHVRIEIIAQTEVADNLMAYLAQLRTRQHSITACLTTVQVTNPDHF